MNKPLAELLRPTSLENYIGQEHLIGKNAPLRTMIDNNNIPSMILWGPPGVGKTSLAKLLAQLKDRAFFTLSAINSGVKDIREVITKAKNSHFFNSPNPILFIDEIHRFSKSQQDSLLGAVEDGTFTLIGATTENPSFEIISPLLSRCQVYTLEHLSKESLDKLIDKAINFKDFVRNKKIDIIERDAMYRFSGGDARKLYNVLEILISSETSDNVQITNEFVTKKLQENIAIYDKNGEQHYDIISALIKSIRGSDPNAAVYWLARMLEGGEDVKFIARRMIILASEDIGLANPNALLMANSCFEAVTKIGMPEARIILSQCVIYLATSLKSNASYVAINEAMQLVKQTGDLPVPLHLRNAPTKLMKNLGYGKEYNYSHNNTGNFKEQEYFPKKLADTNLLHLGETKSEKNIRHIMEYYWKDKYSF